MDGNSPCSIAAVKQRNLARPRSVDRRSLSWAGLFRILDDDQTLWLECAKSEADSIHQQQVIRSLYSHFSDLDDTTINPIFSATIPQCHTIRKIVNVSDGSAESPRARKHRLQDRVQTLSISRLPTSSLRSYWILRSDMTFLCSQQFQGQTRNTSTRSRMQILQKA